jgi:hypothetical protein
VNYPKQDISAYEVIKAAVNSTVDCMFIRDTFMSERFHGLWKGKSNTVEIIASGRYLQTTDGRYKDGQGSFTQALAMQLGRLKGDAEMRYLKSKGVTIPQLLSRDKTLNCNSKRVPFTKPLALKREDPTEYSFRLRPDMIRKDGVLEFYAMRVDKGKGQPKARIPERLNIELKMTPEKLKKLIKDEGYESDPEDEDEGEDEDQSEEETVGGKRKRRSED